MTRVPAPVIGKDTALPIAQNPGQVMIFSHSVRNLTGFVIAGSGTPAFVRMWNVQCLHSPPEKIEADLRSEISILRRILGESVSRELWMYSRYGVLRFFRVEETCLVELKSDGNLIVTSPKETATAGVPAGNDVPSTAGTSAHTVMGWQNDREIRAYYRLRFPLR
ncbi:MAG: hypothetical protein STSR0009_11420 [Methanoregula sp.]